MSNRLTRRDFIKLLGTSAIMYPTTKLFNQADLDHGSSFNKPNFLIVLFDAFTAEHMSLYGYKRRTTPKIEEFAKTSTVFHHHYSSSSHTKPSTSSLLTGVYPWSHRAFIYYTSLLDIYDRENIFNKLPVEYRTLAFTHNMFVTAIFNQFSKDIDLIIPIEDAALYNPNKLPNIFKNDDPLGFYAAKKWRDDYMGPSNSLFINPISRLITGIQASKIQDEYKDLYPLGLSDNQEGYLYKLEDAIDLIGEAATKTQKPFLGYFHLLPPHEAYRPRADFLDKFSGDNFHLTVKPDHFFSEEKSQAELEAFSQRYDEYIALVDSEFGRLYPTLEERGLVDNTYIILTSDHGQMFERGIHGHGQPVLYESAVHIPLIIHSPNQKAENNVFTPTNITDIVPTILHLLGNTSEWCEGKTLPSLGAPEDSERIIFSMESKSNYKMKPITKGTFSAIQWPHKLINYRGYSEYDDIDELYNLEEDPEELNNIANGKQSIVAMLKEELAKSQARAEEKSLGA